MELISHQLFFYFSQNSLIRYSDMQDLMHLEINEGRLLLSPISMDIFSTFPSLIDAGLLFLEKMCLTIIPSRDVVAITVFLHGALPFLFLLFCSLFIIHGEDGTTH